MTLFEKRLAAAEAKVGTGDTSTSRLYVPPTACPDLLAWEQDCLDEATRDGVRPLIVRFVRPGDVPSDGVVH